MQNWKMNMTENLEEHLDRLAVLRDQAEAEGDIDGATEAERLRGVAMGIYPEEPIPIEAAMSELVRREGGRALL